MCVCLRSTKLAASDLFQRPKLMMIMYLPWTMSLPPIFAIDFCVPGHSQLAACGRDLLAMQIMHQVCLLALYKIAASDLFQRPKLMMILYLPQTMSLFPIWVIFSDMFPSSSKENISPTIPLIFFLGSWVGKLWVWTCLLFVICSVVGVLVGFFTGCWLIFKVKKCWHQICNGFQSGTWYQREHF